MNDEEIVHKYSSYKEKIADSIKYFKILENKDIIIIGEFENKLEFTVDYLIRDGKQYKYEELSAEEIASIDEKLDKYIGEYVENRYKKSPVYKQ